MLLLPTALLLGSASGAYAFVTSKTNAIHSRPSMDFATSRLSMVDPIGFAAATADFDIAMEVGVAFVGAAAGAMSQVPRIQELERELTTTREALTNTEQDLVDKIHVLEEKLFAMDAEFEDQTVKFQRQYDQTQRKNMDALKEKLQIELQYKLEIKMAEEKSKGLLQQAVQEHGRSGVQGELSQLRLQQSKLSELNLQLESALQLSDEELANMRKAAAQKKKFLFW